MKYRFFTRISSVLLAALMLSATACSSTEEVQDTAVVTQPAVTEAPVETRPPHNLEDKDFGGKTFRVDTFPANDTTIYVEESNGEVVNDAIYNRAVKLMDLYNFQYFITSTSNGDYGKHTQNITNMVTAGDDSFEMIYGHVVATCNNAILGHYLDLHHVPHLNFEAQWWPGQSVEEMTVYGKMYTICSAMNTAQLASSKVLFFNKDLLVDFGRELPYEWVKNGEWTLDKLIEETSGIYQDTNGNGERDFEDIFGFGNSFAQTGFLISTNSPVLTPTEDGGREIAVMSERTVTLVEKLYDLYYNKESTYLSSWSGENLYTHIFKKGGTAYSFGHLSHTGNYREVEFRYGIIPQPKFDTAQENYYVMACPSLFSIPMTCMDPDFAGFVFEAMTYYGYFEVIPAYYETTLQGKIADSPEDVEMLELINNALTVSFAYCYDNWEGFAHLFASRLKFTEKSGNIDLASTYKQYEKAAQRRLDKCLQGFIDG